MKPVKMWAVVASDGLAWVVAFNKAYAKSYAWPRARIVRVLVTEVPKKKRRKK